MADKVNATALAVKKPRAKSTHPPASGMVNAAIRTLKERNGSSLQAIKKYIAATYKLDVEKQAPFIKKYLKSAVTSGILVQTRGKGAAGSFKLAEVKAMGKKSVASTRPRLASATTKIKKVAATPRKSVTKARKAIAEKKKTPKVAAKPPKAKSTIAKKPKVTKTAPKKIKAAVAASPKKRAPPKGRRALVKKIAKK